jgi:hypothetical protein
VVRVENADQHETKDSEPRPKASNRRAEPVDEVSRRLAAMVLTTFASAYHVSGTETQRNAVLDEAARWVQPRLDAALAVTIAKGPGGALCTDEGLPQSPARITPLPTKTISRKRRKKISENPSLEIPALGDSAITGEGVP